MLGRISVGRWLVVLGLCAAFAAPWPTASVAQELKLAVMDVQKILTDSVKGKAIIAALEKLQSEKMADLKAKQEELNALQAEFTEKRLSLSEEKLEEMQKTLEDKTIALQRAQDDAQREMQKKQQEDFGKIEREVFPVINAVGKEFGYSMIFNKFQSGLVYADESVDITNLIIERFNAVTGPGGN